MKKIYILIILFLIVGSLGFFAGKNSNGTSENDFANLEKNLTELKKDINFYKKLDLYMALMSENDYKSIKTKIEDSSVSEEFSDFMILFFMNELFEDENIKNTIITLKDEVYGIKNKELTEEQKRDLFEKDTACANLIFGIKEQLAKKYKKNTYSTFSATSKEELEFIFYSPTINACLYSTEFSYNNDNYDDYSKSYYTKDKIIYNASTNTQLKSVATYYSSNYPYLSSEERKTTAEKNEIEYIKFILENSNYNIDLIKDLSWF